MRRSSVVFFVLVLVTGLWVPAAAQEQPDGVGYRSASSGLSGTVSISGHLMEAVGLAERGLGLEEVAAQSPVVTFDGGLAEVELRFSAYSEAAVQDAEAAGLVVTARYP